MRSKASYNEIYSPGGHITVTSKRYSRLYIGHIVSSFVTGSMNISDRDLLLYMKDVKTVIIITQWQQIYRESCTWFKLCVIDEG